MGAQPPATQPSLPFAFCNLHPGEQVVGFCASCLRERLAALEPAGSADPPRKSTSSVFKSMFFRSSSTIATGGPSSSSNNFLSSSSVGPELRRCKSFSASRDVAVPVAVEPKRKSCDVRVRNTLWSLFHQDDTVGVGTGNRIVECPNLVFSHSFEVTEDEVREDREEIMAAPKEEMDEEKDRPSTEMRPMKYHIDLESQAKKPQARDLKEIAGTFMLAASVFSQKLRNWRRKQKLKKKPPSAMPSNKNGITTRRLGDAQSEIALDAFGRRSCDIDPGFPSMPAGSLSTTLAALGTHHGLRGMVTSSAADAHSFLGFPPCLRSLRTLRLHLP
ncbi:hypothetical protein HPP92_017560 [Vanilla planifolia]|uniref:Uncharacterized protein n=1 Tax=Vanilla planifolia TaxID=51239 RepID=A0A835Q5A1_VANPL|nr:hypothetical protein HPP92_018190 [Vanilla planifolia]KAG0468232.1 hypothetical protein HPP92_017560 [Vanilla planifolia]